MDIIKELFYGNVNESDRIIRPISKSEDKESELYDKLKSTLSDDENELFENFLTLYGDRIGDEAEDKYCQGFKTGVLVGIECSNLKL
jgi:uncharacterized protein YecA (UPF0149 family)